MQPTYTMHVYAYNYMSQLSLLAALYTSHVIITHKCMHGHLLLISVFVTTYTFNRSCMPYAKGRGPFVHFDFKSSPIGFISIDAFIVPILVSCSSAGINHPMPSWWAWPANSSSCLVSGTLSTD